MDNQSSRIEAMVSPWWNFIPVYSNGQYILKDLSSGESTTSPWWNFIQTSAQASHGESMWVPWRVHDTKSFIPWHRKNTLRHLDGKENRSFFCNPSHLHTETNPTVVSNYMMTKLPSSPSAAACDCKVCFCFLSFLSAGEWFSVLSRNVFHVVRVCNRQFRKGDLGAKDRSLWMVRDVVRISAAVKIRWWFSVVAIVHGDVLSIVVSMFVEGWHASHSIVISLWRMMRGINPAELMSVSICSVLEIVMS